MATVPAWPTLVKGNTGVNVKSLQCLLNYRNSNTALAVDGSFGPAVYDAVVAYQKKNGLTVTGKADASTLSSLITPVKQGTVNNAVRAAQYLLSKFESLTIDGSFGPGCNAAVISFQQKMDIDVDGSVGPITWRYLFGYDSYPVCTILDPAGNIAKTPTFTSSSNISLNYTLDTAKKWIYCNFPEQFNLSHFGDGNLGNGLGNKALNKVTVPAGEHQIFYSYNASYNDDKHPELNLPSSFKFGIQVYNANSTAIEFRILKSAHRDSKNSGGWFAAESGAVSDYYASSAQAVITIPAKGTAWIWERDIPKASIFTGLIGFSVSAQAYINVYVYKTRSALTGSASAVSCDPASDRQYSGLGDGCEYTADYTVLASTLSTTKAKCFNITSKAISSLKINGVTKTSDLIPLKLAASTGKSTVTAEGGDNLGNWCVPYTFHVTLENDTTTSKTIAGYLESLACQNTAYTMEGVAVLRSGTQEKSCLYRSVTDATNNPNKVTTWQWLKQTIPANSSVTFTYTFIMGTNSGGGWRQIFKLV